MKDIKLFCMDVDGTLTDGKIYMGENGEVFKAFNIKDGYAIHEILPKYNIIPVIITGRKSKIVENRARELEIVELHQGHHEKKPILLELVKKYNCNFENVAFVGDDVLDKECMELCGIDACPADAAKEVKEICDFISTKNGGDGAVREIIEWLVIGDQKR